MNTESVIPVQNDTRLKSIMVSRRWSSIFSLGAVLSFAAVLFLSSMYCLLAYIPSTYYAFIQAPFLAWMPLFARLQPYLFAITFCGTAIPLWPGFRSGTNRGLIIEFWFIGILTSTYLVWARPVQFLGNNSLSFIWAIAFLLPLICLGTIHYVGHLGEIKGKREEPRSFSYARVTVAALFVSLLYPGTSYLRFHIAGMPSPLTKPDLMAWIWAVITHVSLFLFVFSLAELATYVTARSANPALMRFLLCTALCWLGSAIFFSKVVLASIPFAGIEATVYTYSYSLAAVMLVAGWRLKHLALRNTAMAAAQQPPRPERKRLELAASFLFIIASALTIPSLIGSMDWHSIVEKIWAVIFWCFVTGLIVFRYPLQRRRQHAWPVVAVAILSLTVFRGGLHFEKSWGAIFSEQNFDAGVALRQHAVFDASFAAASELMTPDSSLPCNQQCQFLAEQTNIPASASLDLHDISLTQNTGPNNGKKPNIFIIVVDSLRSDYLSPYNPAVSFTPAIGSFGQDSVVFRNAFTRYAGTTLAEPAIWAGILQLHKHYAQPFHLTNNLEKMVQADGYQNLVSVDTVLRIVLQPNRDLVQLDEKIPAWTDLDFCSTESEAMDKISHRQDRTDPIFLYTQPQNVHVMTLRKTTVLRPPRKKYGPFTDYYASELERLDGCFGQFIGKLKAQGLYENSIIVFTADHGEDLDKVGAERHAFSLKPEVIRVPLIMHVPQAIKDSWYYDPDVIAFNTDITATLYEILGQGPVVARPEFGRPLFTQTSTDMEKYRQSSYMIASSYGFLYGLLYDNGKRLFIESREGDEFYDLEKDPHATHNVLTEEMRRRSEAILQNDVQKIGDLYGYKYSSPTILNWLTR